MAKRSEESTICNEMSDADSKILSKYSEKALKKWRDNYDNADYMKMNIKNIIEHCFVNGYLLGMTDGKRVEPLKKIIEELSEITIITRQN